MAVTLPYTFTSGTTIRSSEVNANFDSLNNRTQWVTPEMFGGSIQAAIDSLSSGEIRLSVGTYTVAAPITLKSNISLIGAGMGVTTIKGVFASPVNRIITSSANVLQTNITIKNLTVDRTGANAEHGIILGGVNGLRIQNVGVVGMPGHAVGSGAIGISPFDEFAAVQSVDVLVDGCRIEQCDNFGIAFGNVKGGAVNNCTFLNCYRECIGFEAWGGGVGVPASNTGGTDGRVEECSASGNKIYITENASYHNAGSVGPAIYIGGASGGYCGNIIISENLISFSDRVSTSYHGIYSSGGADTDHYTENVIIENNVIIRPPACGVAVGALGAYQRLITIKDNRIIEPSYQTSGGKSGIAIRNTNSCFISENTVTGTYHNYAFSEEVGSALNVCVNNHFAPGTLGTFYLVASTSVYSDPSRSKVTGGIIFQESVGLDDGASHAFTTRQANNRGIYFLTSDFDDTTYAIFTVNGSSAVTEISVGSSARVATTNGAVAGAVNVWTSSSSVISIQNKLGSARNFVLTSINAG